jgi:hypothetical protein
LAEELEECGLSVDQSDVGDVLLEEIDQALRPPVHERWAVSGGTIVEPTSDPFLWAPGTQLEITRGELGDQPLPAARRFADGLSSWVLRRVNDHNEWVVFDRPAGSERDLVVMAGVFGATIVQRHPSGMVRVVGPSGVFRWEGVSWHHEPPVTTWLTALGADAAKGDAEGAAEGGAEGAAEGDADVLGALLAFAVHDLGSVGIGALLVYRPRPEPGPPVEERLPEPPRLQIRLVSHLAPLRHALAQIDGAAVFDGEGVLRLLGVRLMTSEAAERNVEALGGTRHTSARRYSYDDPFATVIAVSDDGPVSVFRAGSLLGSSHEPT